MTTPPFLLCPEEAPCARSPLQSLRESRLSLLREGQPLRALLASSSEFPPVGWDLGPVIV